MNSPIDIIMTTWCRPEMTELAIKTLAKNTTTSSHLTVIDNGSSYEMKKMLLELQKMTFIYNLVLLDENIGLEPAKNIGLHFVKSDYFISTDNDILAEKPKQNEDWLSKLLSLINQNPEYAAISCRTQVMVGTGNIFNGQENRDIVEFPHPGGSLRIMRTELVKEIGGWRDDIRGRGSEETYICGRLRELGFKTGFANKIYAYHMFGKSNWGYPQDWKPEEHGHSSGVWHPAIINGDNVNELEKYI